MCEYVCERACAFVSMCVGERDIVKDRQNVFVNACARDSAGKAALVVNK